MEQKHPKISLLIFTYNRAHLVEKAINSVLNQTYRDFELVLVNNGSTDNTREVLEKYANHKNARVIHVEKNLGSNGGFNFALDQIRGEWWGQMGDDDRLYEYALETMMNVLDEVVPSIPSKLKIQVFALLFLVFRRLYYHYGSCMPSLFISP